MARTSYMIPWDEYDVHAYLDFYSVCSLKQQSAGSNIAPLWHIIMIPSQPVLVLTTQCCVISIEAASTHFIVFDLTR
jgi:hypothetical protein